MGARHDQHFLIDPDAVDRIVDAWPVEGRRVLEIGPGQGVLTFALLEAGALVDAIEYDPRLVQVLSTRFSREISEERLTLHLGDAAREPWPPFQVMVSNLPYSISSPVVFRLLETRYEAAVLMFQREFAERMRAFIGTPDCGRLSVMVQTFARVEACFVLSPSSFSPPPKVESMVVRITPRDPLFPVEDREVYGRVVRALFLQRRKTVRNGLKAASGLLGASAVHHLLLSLPEEVLASRPEALYLEDFATIANSIARFRG
ncbi:MAG TPA: 16S rRNA (adenine(1518)-N(6)/adenine(1519)-N(6))-dimethyltransferase RsmA [Methanoregulaceae archaeon]|nr:16S rRNA (adenine(1518)-N(6)/adenine(1519)-N(6))-dimethyltransferase RsmA [Methanoregulaceae archaeon]